MTYLSGVRTRTRLLLALRTCCVALVCLTVTAPAFSQELSSASLSLLAGARGDVADKAGQPGKELAPAKYVPAIKLLPESVAGLIRIPNLPRFRAAWDKTHAGQLMKEESMQPFIEAQRARAEDYFQSINNKIGIRVEDLFAIGSGEVVVSWLPFEKDKRRPYALCVIADTRGNGKKAEEVMKTIDKDLKAGGWTRTDVTHRDQEVRVYNSKPKPGQLKVEQLALALSDVRLIAADRDTVVTDLLDSIAGQPKGGAIADFDDFKTVLSRSANAIRKPIEAGGGTIGCEWFAKPFQMGRIIRESLDVDRGNQVDILKLLENQGFDVIRAAGGVMALAGQKYDVLHRGYVIAPQDQLDKAAKMLQFANVKREAIPAWVHENAGSFNRLNMRIEEAFWASETLINEAFGDEIFRDIIEGIRDDEDGPQIDIAKNVLPNLDDEIIFVTDNTQPANINADRLLVAIRVNNAEAIKKAIQKAMEVEPDASKMDVLPGVEIWRVERGESEEDFDAELFSDLELGFEDEEEDEAPPLLDHWAIALVDKGPGSNAPYLMFSSHPELLVLTAKRVQNGGGGLQTVGPIKKAAEAIDQLGGQAPAFDRVVRTKLSLRSKYELLRQGKLKESTSILAALYRRIFEDEDGDEEDPLNAAKLPPMAKIEKHFPTGGSLFEVTKDGWNVSGFLFK